MNKADFTKRLARATGSSRAEAADYLDQTVFSILKRLKGGQAANWPGLGVFLADLQPPKKQKGPRVAQP